MLIVLTYIIIKILSIFNHYLAISIFKLITISIFSNENLKFCTKNGLKSLGFIALNHTMV